MDGLGLTRILQDKQCDRSDPLSVFATSYQGWSSGMNIDVYKTRKYMYSANKLHLENNRFVK